MSQYKERVNNTDLGNLVSNLRGEIGEIVLSWILMRSLKVQSQHLKTDNIVNDMNNSNLNILYNLIEKLENEIIARLSELAEKKVGQLTFYFVQEKLGLFEEEVDTFAKFIHSNRFHEKRNYDISHKQLPEKWSEHKCIYIPYSKIVKGIVLALRLMRKIDRIALGPSAPFLWREMRKRRYNLTQIPTGKSAYMLLPYLCLSAKERIQIAFLEGRENKSTWVDMETTINGSATSIQACKKWGVVRCENFIMTFEQYPLIEIKSIEIQKTKTNPNNNGKDITKKSSAG